MMAEDYQGKGEQVNCWPAFARLADDLVKVGKGPLTATSGPFYHARPEIIKERGGESTEKALPNCSI